MEEKGEDEDDGGCGNRDLVRPYRLSLIGRSILHLFIYAACTTMKTTMKGQVEIFIRSISTRERHTQRQPHCPDSLPITRPIRTSPIKDSNAIMRHVLLDLVHNLNCLQCTPRFKVIPFLLCGIISTQNDDSKALRVPPTDLAAHHIVEVD